MRVILALFTFCCCLPLAWGQNADVDLREQARQMVEQARKDARARVQPIDTAGEVIRLFQSDITPVDPATLQVTETIVMDFGTHQRRGIFRNIPYRYERFGGQFTVKLVDVEVTDAEGRARPTKLSRSGGVLTIRIGDPDVYVTGEHFYRISYTARRAVNFFDGMPEVYWNVTGNEWPFPILEAVATLHLPEGVVPANVKTDAFIGALGSTRRGQIEVAADTIVFSARELRGNEGLTILAGLPEGSVAQAGWLTTIGWWVSDWWPAVVLPLLSLGGMTALWFTRGRDAGANDAVPVEWDPPAGLAPAEVGILIDEVCHTHDVIATVIDLAVRGHLRIEKTGGSTWLALSKDSWKFVKTRPEDLKNPWQDHERDLMRALFGTASEVTLAELKGTFYKDFDEIRDDLYRSMTNRGLFTGNPALVRGAWITFGVIVPAAGVVLGFLTLDGGSGWFPWAVGIGLAALPILAFARFMPARTLEGSRLLRECRGFRRFLMAVERDRLAEAQHNDPTLFGRLLPYAMVLGVEDRWAEQFEGLLTQEPEWFQSGHRSGFVPGLFISDFGRGVSAMGSSMTSRPASSGAGGGSSGFSSGGGFSGGGFGGGGGGSW